MLLAPLRPCGGDRPSPGRDYEDDSVRQVLVVRQRRATVAPSPVRQVLGLGGPDQRVVEELREGEWEGLEEIELWPEEDEGQGVCGDEGGPGPP